MASQSVCFFVATKAPLGAFLTGFGAFFAVMERECAYSGGVGLTLPGVVDVWVKGLLLAGVYGWGQEKSPLARALGGSEAVTQVEGHNRHEPVSSGRSRLARRMT